MANVKRQRLVDEIRLLTVKCNKCGTYYSTIYSEYCTKCGANDGIYTTPCDKAVIDSLVEATIKSLKKEIADKEHMIAILKDKTDYPEIFVRPADGAVFVLNKNNQYVCNPPYVTSDYEYSYESMVASRFYPIRKEMLEIRN